MHSGFTFRYQKEGYINEKESFIPVNGIRHDRRTDCMWFFQ